VASQPVRVYLTGGATAVLDIHLRLEPEDDALLRQLPKLKERLDVNLELASPPDFIPELPGWRDRSPFVLREGAVQVHHFDPYSQALSKIERGFGQDREDVAAMLERGLVEPGRLLELFEAVEGELYRYPAIDPGAFRERVVEAIGAGPAP
jgi:hypothetical protein